MRCHYTPEQVDSMTLGEVWKANDALTFQDYVERKASEKK
jgi:hypothetical protein